MKLSLCVLALIIVSFGCSDGSDSRTEPKRTYVRVELDSPPSLNCLISQISGTLTSRSTNWQSNTILLSDGDSTKVEVPSGGTYRVYFTNGGLPFRDYDLSVSDGTTTTTRMKCP